MELVNFRELNKSQLLQAAQILTASLPLGWADLMEAEAEIKKRFIPENVLLAAVEGETILGWGGALPEYDGNVWELHPLAVRADFRLKGIGRAIVSALEAEAEKRGGLTMWLGADDERDGGETSLANTDLFDGLPKKIADFQPGRHQTAFYRKLGYKIVGVMPDANGRGKPDIYMAKRLRP